MAVKLIIDAGCDLSQKQAEALGVILIPMTIRFGNEEYRSGIDLSHEEFYHKLAESTDLPTTSQPAPFVYEEIYRKIKDRDEEAVVLCVSSALSGTYQSAVIASDGYEDCIYVVDTRAVSLAQKILLDYAIALKKHGASAKEIANAIEAKKEHVCAYGAVETLEYLIKGGRLSKAAGAVGSVLGIRPILYLQDGELAVAGKARGAKGAITMTHDLISKVGIDYSMPFSIGYTGTDRHMVDAFLESPNSPWKEQEIPVLNVGSTVGTHTGPGLFIAAFFKKS